ncbi:MAG TPA: translocation/assembly module TamB domain-containing protein, partial [Burkholderiales bacterium]|nr:translocation/assembly module TamB domain-containing protein [Burkholderiales bacterium]
VSGALDRQWNLIWQVNAPDLAALIPNAAGNARGSGRLSGTRALPQIEVRASVDRLRYAGTQIRAASVEATIDLSDRAHSHATLSATQGTLFKREFERIAVSVDGLRTDHSVAVDARWAQATFTAELRGAYADNTWNGTVTKSNARLGNESWSLVGQPKLVAAPDYIRLAQTCWSGGNTRACVELSGAAGTPTSVVVSTQELPLLLLAPLLPNPPDWHGTVSGDAKLQFDGGRLAQAQSRLEFSAGEVTLLDTTHTVFAYDRAASQVTIDEKGLHASAELALPGGDGGTAELTLPQFHSDIDFSRQSIIGRLTFTMRNLAPVAALLPQLEDLKGALQIQLSVGGTLADPRVRGEAALTNGAANIVASGIRVHDLRLTATADGGDELRLSGEAQSGPGRLALSGRVIFPNDRAWRAELRITGEQFHVADLRDTQIFVSPDLRANLAPGEIDVTGSVRIPKASFALLSQKSDVVKTSADIVIVNAPADTPKPETRWKVSAQIRVLLGDEVTFSGFGLNAKIAGDVALTEVPAQLTTARGEVRVVKGQYDAYGRKLDVERGRLVFLGGPVTNPGIDARAVRKIDQVTAGVEIRGTLQAPQLTLFTEPAMSQSDALSYLLFGRPMEGASAEEGRSLAAAARALKLAGGERLAQ